MKYLVVILLATAMAALVIAGCGRRQGQQSDSSRLKARLQARPDFIVLVGVPLEAPARWTRASSYTSDEIVTPEGRFGVASVRAFVVAYPNMQVLDVNTAGLEVPDGFEMLAAQPPTSDVHIGLAEATEGLNSVDVRFGPSAANPAAVDSYRTTLRNLTIEPIRVLKFGAFVESNGEYSLHTVTGQLFTADEFIAWYGAPADGWIPPGSEVTDADNYGGPPILWAYYCQTKSGRQFVTGRVVGP